MDLNVEHTTTVLNNENVSVTVNAGPSMGTKAPTVGFVVPTLTQSSAANRTAIQNALATARTEGKIVLLPAGVWPVAGEITVQTDDYIMGPGSRRCVLYFNGSSGLVGQAVQHLTLKGFKVDGASAAGTHDGIRLTNTGTANNQMNAYLLAEDVYVRAFGRYGWYVENTWVATLTRCFAENNLGPAGFYFKGVNISGTSTTFTSCYANGNANTGFLLERMTYCSLISCAADNNVDAYYVLNSQLVTLVSPGAEYSKGRGWVFDASHSCKVLEPFDMSTQGEVGIDVINASTNISIDGYRELSPGANKLYTIRAAANTNGQVLNYRHNASLRATNGIATNGYWSKPDRLGQEPISMDHTSVDTKIASLKAALSSMGRIMW